MTRLPSYLGVCPHCKARVALSARVCAGCARPLAPGVAERAAAKEGLYGHRAQREPAPDDQEGHAPAAD